MPGVITDLRGQRFGRLRVPARSEPEIRNRRAYWPCVCDCGGMTWVRGTKLREGRIVSCGCYRADPAVRSAARLRIPPKERRRLASIRR